MKNIPLVFFLLPILIFIFFTLPIISWGIPNGEHPFPYQMDEWHSFNALKEAAEKGPFRTGKVLAGPQFYFFSTAFYLLPFYLLGLVKIYSRGFLWENPDVLSSLFVILRSQNVVYGIGIIVLLYLLGKRFFKAEVGLLAAFLLVFTPAFSSWSTFYIYNTANTFWTLLAFYFLLGTLNNPDIKNYLKVGVASGISLATKLSSLPFVGLIILLGFFEFLTVRRWAKIVKKIFFGLLILVFTFVALGIPYVFSNIDWKFFLRLGLLEYLEAQDLPGNYPRFLHALIFVLPKSYGRGIFLLFLVSIIIFIFSKKSKSEFFLFISLLLFYYPFGRFGVGAHAGRILVMMPLLLLFIASQVTKIANRWYAKVAIFSLLIFQFFYTYFALEIRRTADVRKEASEFLSSRLFKNAKIAVEGDPIYVLPPDILQNDYFKFHQFKYAYFGNDNYDLTSLSRGDVNFIIMNNMESKPYFGGDPKYKNSWGNFRQQLLNDKRWKLIAVFKKNLQFIGDSDQDLGLYEAPHIYIFERVKS